MTLAELLAARIREFAGVRGSFVVVGGLRTEFHKGELLERQPAELVESTETEVA